MAGATKVGGRGEVMPEELNEETVRKFMNDTKASQHSLAEVYAKDQLLMMYALPDPIKKRLRALKKLQVSIINTEADFFKDVHKLELKYQQQYKPVFEKRAKIVAGKYEPNEEELHPDVQLPELPLEVESKLKLEQAKLPEGPGIPNFWLTIFRNVTMLSEITYPHDEDILKYLVDVKLALRNEPMGFRIEFIFSPNEYFTNTVLTKDYDMSCCPEDNDPFAFEGPEIINATGCTIDWKPGKDITVKTIKKKQKHKAKGTVRTLLKTVKSNSFFNFFSPPSTSEVVDEDIQIQLTSDFEIGHFLKERVIPHAILFYTGEALEDEESYDDDDEEDEDTGSSRSQSSEDEDEEQGRFPTASESEESVK